MEATKRIRSTNFTTSEMDNLLALVEKHKLKIENKKTDSISNKEKDVEWEHITEKFNALVGTGRTAKQLRMKWESWKKLTRKSYSIKKANLCKAGVEVQLDDFTDWEKRILAVIGISNTDVDYKFDSDNFESSSVDSASNDMLTNVKIEFNSPNNEGMINDINLVDAPQLSVSSCNNKYEDLEEYEMQEDVWPQCNPELVKPIHTVLLAHEEVEDDEKEESIDQDPSFSCRTINTQTKDTKIISSRKRKINCYRPCREHVALLDNKMELISLQKTLLEKEFEAKERRSQEKHELEIKEFETKERRHQEKHELEMLILKKSLENIKCPCYQENKTVVNLSYCLYNYHNCHYIGCALLIVDLMAKQ